MGNRTALKDAWSSAVTRANVTLAVGFGCAVSWSPTLLTAATPDNVMNALVNKPPHGACMPSLVAAVLACLVLFLGGRRLFVVRERTVRPLALGVAMALMGAVFVLPLVTRNSVTVTGDVVIAVAGAPKRELLEKRNSAELEQLMEQRRSYRYHGGESRLRAAESVERYHLGVAAPIVAEGDLMGCVMLLMGEHDAAPTESEQALAQTFAGFLGKQMES